LYADDTVILSKSAKGLQDALNVSAAYCDKWKLVLNTSKTKVIVLAKG
jgi:hypothetical protein